MDADIQETADDGAEEDDSPHIPMPIHIALANGFPRPKRLHCMGRPQLEQGSYTNLLFTEILGYEILMAILVG